jgi:hypothetical protein
MKQKEILEFVQSTVDLLNEKVSGEEKTTPKLPTEMIEYSKGQLYEASYILGHIEEIIFKD